MMKPFQILGKLYIPDWPYGGGIYMSSSRNPLRALIGMDTDRRWEYRTPAHTRQMAADPGSIVSWGYHQDGDTPNQGVILWSNEYPTEIRTVRSINHRRKHFRGEPFDVVLIDNAALEHRVPHDFIDAVRSGRATNRHFIRYIVGEYPSDEKIHRWIEAIKGSKYSKEA